MGKRLQVDLERVYELDWAMVTWHTLYAKEHTISGSVDGTTWNMIAHQGSNSSDRVGTVGAERIALRGRYRYVKIDMIRGLQAHMSILEFAVYGGGAQLCPPQFPSTFTYATYS